ncbi:PAS domain S-box protein [Candidatus Contendibacter odensensis]|uniref:histidine kinase n=1 Tax=Candidatus Contendobacter odensis Run_B_J11 TaxID=1400861 RepID=A0A7U7J221_9GAMM|nr:PAS domain S-box protein [Candidatus Contendobacter odensis]CDH44518.1 putative Histidine kinase [Candidatus Contendobacter odensis Run_B_J11]
MAVLYWIHPTGKFLYASEQACCALGYSREVLQTMAVWDIDPGFPCERWPDHWRELRQAQMLHLQTTHRRRDGSLIPVEVSVHYVEIDGNEYNCALVREITEPWQTEKALRESEERLALALAASGQGLYDLDIATGKVVFSKECAQMLGYTPSELKLTSATWASWLHPADREQALMRYEDCVTGKRPHYQAEFRLRTRSGRWIWVLSMGRVVEWDTIGRPSRMMGTHLNITERKQAEEVLQRRILALTQPLNESESVAIQFTDLFNLEDVQRIQDAFAEATSVASIITQPDGVPITEPSNFCRLCMDVIRKTEKGLSNCFYSDAMIGRYNPGGPIVQLCLSGGLWDAGASITVGGKHIANWLIGQVKNEALDETRMLRYASEINADPIEFRAALADVPVMSKERFGKVSQALFLLANELSAKAYQNIQQARSIAERHKVEAALRESEARFRSIFDHAPLGIALVNSADGRITLCNAAFQHLIGYSAEQLQGMTVAEITCPDDISKDMEQYRALLEDRLSNYSMEKRYLHRDGAIVWVNLTVSAIRDEAGKPAYAMGMVEDITERKRAEKAIQENERLFRLLFEKSGDANLLLDGEIFFDCNEITVKMLGAVTKEQVLQRRPAELSPERQPDGRLSADKAQEIIAMTFREGSHRFEWVHRRLDGTDFWVEVLLTMVPWHGQQILHTAWRDISERKRTEEVLQLMQLSIMRASDAVFWILPDGRFVNVNEQACHSLGYTRDELLSMAVWDVDPGFPQEKWSSHWERTRQLAKRHFETQHQRKDGTIFPVEITANHIEYNHQEYDFAFARDITERKRTETALRESEARLRTAIESIPFDFFLINANGCYVLQNSSSKKNWGDVVGKRPEEVTDNAEMLAHWNGNNRRAFAGEILEEDALLIVGDEERCIHNVIAPIKDQDEILGIVGLNIDITDRKRAEAELQRHREHLEELVAERTADLQRANTELRQAMDRLVQAEKLAALGSLVAGVAHELNTPLGNTRTVASALGESLREFAAAVETGALRRSQLEAFLARGRQAVDLLEKNTARASDLIGSFKQIAVDQTSVRRRLFPLRQTLEEVIVTLQPLFKRTAHRVELDIPRELTLDSYPGPLEQVITNLINNSLTHGFDGIATGMIRIHAVVLDATQIRLDYSDNGIGVSENILKHLFDPFFTTKLGCGGSGLGLYIVYNLTIGMLGGNIQIRSTLGQGTTFELTLPRRAPDSSAFGVSA